MARNNPLLLDTCALIWATTGAAVDASARAVIESKRAAMSGIYVSPMSAWEIGLLSRTGKIRLNADPLAWFDMAMTRTSLRLAELDPTILVASTDLPGDPPRDPVDRIIIATVRRHQWTLVTRDRRIIDYGAAGFLSVLPC